MTFLESNSWKISKVFVEIFRVYKDKSFDLCISLLYRVQQTVHFSSFLRIKRVLLMQKLSYQCENSLLKQQNNDLSENKISNFVSFPGESFRHAGLGSSKITFVEYSYQIHSNYTHIHCFFVCIILAQKTVICVATIAYFQKESSTKKSAKVLHDVFVIMWKKSCLTLARLY